jgi:hypothetical protein
VPAPGPVGSPQPTPVPPATTQSTPQPAPIPPATTQ